MVELVLSLWQNTFFKHNKLNVHTLSWHYSHNNSALSFNFMKLKAYFNYSFIPIMLLIYTNNIALTCYIIIIVKQFNSITVRCKNVALKCLKCTENESSMIAQCLPRGRVNQVWTPSNLLSSSLPYYSLIVYSLVSAWRLRIAGYWTHCSSLLKLPSLRGLCLDFVLHISQRGYNYAYMVIGSSETVNHNHLLQFMVNFNQINVGYIARWQFD